MTIIYHGQSLQLKQLILKKIFLFTMNFKERGITIGDLLIIIIIILASTILLKVFNKDKNSTLNSTLNSNNQVINSNKKITLSKAV